MPQPAVRLEKVSKRFGHVQSLAELSFEIEPGAVFGLLGPNGAGKTTTFRALLGLVRPDAGSVSVLGLDPQHEGQRVRRHVGAVLERDGLYDRLTAWDNLDFHGRIRHLTPGMRARRSQQLLESFQLWDRRKDQVAGWSKGMRQRLAVARALLHEPPLLLLDEPFSGLDPIAAVDLRDLVAELAVAQGTTVVIATHDLAHVERVCDTVVLINAGRLLAQGPPDRIGADANCAEMLVVGEGLQHARLADMMRDGLLESFHIAGRSARIVCAREATAGLATELVRRGVLIEEIHRVDGSLENAFLRLVAADQQGGPGER